MLILNCENNTVQYGGLCVDSDTYNTYIERDAFFGGISVAFALISFVTSIVCFAFYKKGHSEKTILFIISCVCLVVMVVSIVLTYGVLGR